MAVSRSLVSPALVRLSLEQVFYMSVYDLPDRSYQAPLIQFARVLLPPQLLGDGHMLLDLYTLVW
jgi:hypothetical protein